MGHCSSEKKVERFVNYWVLEVIELGVIVFKLSLC